MKKNILLAVLCILVLGLGGFILYDKVMKKDIEIETVKSDTENNSNIVEKDTKETNGLTSTLNSYELYRDNLIKSMKQSENDVFKSENLDLDDGHYIVNLTKDMNLFLRKNGSYYTNTGKDVNYLIKNNIIDFYLVPGHQTGKDEIYFINSDGTVGKFRTDSYIYHGETKIENYQYKNIVSISSTSSCRNCNGETDIIPLFVDINGNIYK